MHCIPDAKFSKKSKLSKNQNWPWGWAEEKCWQASKKAYTHSDIAFTVEPGPMNQALEK